VREEDELFGTLVWHHSLHPLADLVVALS